MIRLERDAGWLAHLALAGVAGLVLTSAAQPLQTDDLWWHLALGRAYAQEGPRLASDPLLHTAEGPPAPAAWLADLALYGVGAGGGFGALRVAHASLVAAILALAWSLLRRASGSPRAASLGTGGFAALAAYRLFQLRPELLTILATLLLLRWILDGREPLPRRRVAFVVALQGLWANLHSGFLLGPILIGVALSGLGIAAALGPPGARQRGLARARPLAWALGLGLVATLVNPSGVAQHLAWLRAGAQTPQLAVVVDEWARVDLLHAPVANLPPSLLAFCLVWTLLVLTAPLAVRAALRWRRGESREADADPVLVALAVAGLAAMLLAVRFLWLGILPALLVARAGAAWHRAGRVPRPFVAIATAAAALCLVPAFVRLGDWPMISGTLPSSRSRWAQPFPPAKYCARAIWLLADAGLEGRLMNEYFQGGFLGYWLAPGLRAFVNGSLNLPKEALAAHSAFTQRRGLGKGAGFLELLDRHGVDLFLGIGLPQAPRGHRPRIYSSGHLERAPGWIPVFRDPQSAAYLRANPRNHANLARVAEYYARAGVPFDPARGFDPAAVIRDAPAWAEAHGIVPAGLAAIQAEADGPDPARKRAALDRLASLHVALGSYEEAVALDRALLRANPGANAPSRRLVWSLLRLGRNDEASEEARALAPADGLSAAIAAAARRAEGISDADALAALWARLPVFTRSEASRVLAGVAPAPPRAWRRLRSGPRS